MGKGFFRYTAYALLALAVLYSSRCRALFLSQGQYTLVSWNVQNLFDSHSDGSEYDEYIPENGWSWEMYMMRLELTAEVLSEYGSVYPDFICLQEVENRRVLDDLNEIFLENLYFPLLVPTEGSAVNTGILSRFPPESVHMHYPEGEHQRGILECRFQLEDGLLILLNNHWKSRLGGLEETEYLRKNSAERLNQSVLRLRARYPEAFILCLGDFNENPDEYTRQEKAFPVAMINGDNEEVSVDFGACLNLSETWAFHPDRKPCYYEPWFSFDEISGSYLYGREWEQIDHVLAVSGSPDLLPWEPLDFTIWNSSAVLDENREPFRWDSLSGEGYSDHLPLGFVFGKP